MKLFWRRRFCIACVLALSGSVWVIAVLQAQPAPAEKNAARTALPSANATKNAQTQISEIYKAQFFKARNSKDAGLKREFANALYTQSKETGNDLASRYVCLLESRKLMEVAGDPNGALRSIDAMGTLFEVDLLPLKAVSLRAVLGKSKQDFQWITVHALELAEEAEQRGKFDIVSQLLETAQLAALRTKERGLIKLTGDLRGLIPDQKKEFEANQKALTVLATTPNDPAANVVVGRYLCLVRGDWATGGPKLQNGNDEELKAIAVREAAKPQALADVLALAQAWQVLAEKQTGSFKPRMLREAAYWFHLASFDATGLQKAQCEKLAQQVSGMTPRSSTAPGLMTFLYEGQDFNTLRATRIDARINMNFGNGGPAEGLPNDNFSLVWVGQLKIPSSGTYVIHLVHDDGGRVWIDDINIINHWGGAAENAVELQLREGLHALRVEYNERGGTAGVTLAWKQGDGELQTIPETAYFHSPELARVRGVK